MGRFTRIALIVLTCNDNEDTYAPENMLRQELERAITEVQKINTRWSLEKVTILEDP